VAGGSYHWDGHVHELARNDKDGPNAIHGFVRTMDWELASRSETSAEYSLPFAGAAGYPFPLLIRLEYTLGDTGLSASCTITNTGRQDAPVAMGFHPYFTVGSPTIDQDVLSLPFTDVLEFEQLIPTGRVLSVADGALDFRSARRIGATRFNHCFATPIRDPDRRGAGAAARRRAHGERVDGRRVRLRRGLHG
jgi:aldose 1-epimerase